MSVGRCVDCGAERASFGYLHTAAECRDQLLKRLKAVETELFMERARIDRVNLDLFDARTLLREVLPWIAPLDAVDLRVRIEALLGGMK